MRSSAASRLPFGVRDPRRGAEALHFDFGRPVGVLGGLQRLDDARELLHVALGRGRVAAARGAQGAREVRDGDGERGSGSPAARAARPPSRRRARPRSAPESRRAHRASPCAGLGTRARPALPRPRGAHRCRARAAGRRTPGSPWHATGRRTPSPALATPPSARCIARRILPRADAREDVRGHVQRVRRRGRDLGVAPGRVQSLLRRSADSRSCG